jgi:gliding motility-associated-like protein
MKKNLFFLLCFQVCAVTTLYSQVSSIGGIINNYTPALAFDRCNNHLTVQDASAFGVGDTVLLIQMKGAIIDSSNTANFGSITDYGNSGNYEFNYVISKSGNILVLKNNLIRPYDMPNGKVQLIRVPYYQNATVTSTLTCAPWDGSKGGVLVLNVANDVVLNADIDISGKGFRGGTDPVTNPPVFYCYENDYFYPVNPDLASEKGEGIALISSAKSYGKGALANGGGGGNSHNSGGGGGGNAGLGGSGGYQFEGSPCNTTIPFDNKGIGGNGLSYNQALNKIFLGGGGGAGQSNNPQGFQAKGGNGAGIAIIVANNLRFNSRKIFANGLAGAPCGTSGAECHDGMGGGGAGGTVLLSVNNFTDAANIEIKGGKGADMTASGFLKVAPGGGGGGGMAWYSKPALLPNIAVVNAGGLNGAATAYNNDPWGANAGQNGYNLFNLQLPFDNTAFRPNIDSVRINNTGSCLNTSFEGVGYTNTSSVAGWQWFFGDGGTATTQNVTYTYIATGTFSVKLIATDINGCKDSITTDVTVTNTAGPIVKTSDDIAVCEGLPVQLNSTGASSYSWSPSTGLDNTTVGNPIAKPLVTTKYIVTGKNSNGCAANDTVTITVRPKPIITKLNDTTICKNSTVQLFAAGGNSYSWSPSASLNNASIPNPIAAPSDHTVYFVTLTDGNNCTNTDSIKVNIFPDPVFSLTNSSTLCKDQSIQLNAKGGNTYAWQPATSLNNPGIPNPIAAPKITTSYSVTITETACNNSVTLSTTIDVLPLPNVQAIKSNDIDCTTEFSELTATGAEYYKWTPATSLSNAKIANPIARPTNKTDYIVEGKDVNGCINYDTVTVNITALNASGYWTASAFTPNSDGINDCFGIKHWGVIEKLDFKIFNRWGELVFFTTNPGDCWDGIYKGLRQPSAVFPYIIRAKTICGDVFRKGTVTLIR